MKINPINQNQTNFKALYMTIRAKENMSDTQLKIYEDIKEKFNRPFADDKKGRSYMQYLEDMSNLDFFVDTSTSKDSLLLYERYNKANGEQEKALLWEFIPGTELSEDFLYGECDIAKFKYNYGKNMKRFFYTAAGLAITAFFLLPILGKRKVNNSMLENPTTILKDSLNKLSKDTLDLTKHFVK
jgi:hypothetical protein